MRPRLALLAALALALLAAAPVAAEKCGSRANGRRCTDPKACCSKYGWCGTDARFCSKDRCISGACLGTKVPAPTPKPVPAPTPKPVPAAAPSPKPPVPRPSPKPSPAAAPETPPEGLLRGARAGLDAEAKPACKPSNHVITAIYQPIFGNPGKACNSSRSYSVVARACLGKRDCTVKADVATFGDPCGPKVNKWLYLRYTCGLARNAEPEPAAGAQYSKLWGVDGERWSPTSRLVDFSYAGYMANEASIPRYPVKVDVTDFGAKGDGITDDTEAFIRAIAKASELAKPFSTVACGGRGDRRCLSMGDGFQNKGANGVAVLIPAGTYRITRMVEIAQSNVVLRGEGKEQTILWFPKGLKELYGNEMDWAFMGGFLVLHGRNYDSGDTEVKLADVERPISKGQRRIYVTDTSKFVRGSWVRVFARSPLRQGNVRRSLLGDAGGVASTGSATAVPRPLGNGTAKAAGKLPTPAAFVAGWEQVQINGINQDEHATGGGDGANSDVEAAVADDTLDAYLYGNNFGGSVSSGTRPYGGERVRFLSRVAAVGAGFIDLERPLPYDLRMAWQPAVYSFVTPLQHSGFEDFTVHFKWAPYPAHMNVVGNNGIWMYGSSNVWIKNVHFIDADTGAEAQNTDFVTMTGCSFSITASRGTYNTQYADGHHGLWSAASSNVRITDFNFQSRFIHDLTLDVFSQECVYHRGKGIDVSLDMHRSAVHNNLLSNIDVGEGTRPFASSGSAPRGAHAASNNTYWNIWSSARTKLFLPDCDFGPDLNFIGGPYGPPDDCKNDESCKHTTSTDTSDYPQWCPPRNDWFVEQRQTGKTLQPVDIFAAQVDKRLQRRRL